MPFPSQLCLLCPVTLLPLVLALFLKCSSKGFTAAPLQLCYVSFCHHPLYSCHQVVYSCYLTLKSAAMWKINDTFNPLLILPGLSSFPGMGCHLSRGTFPLQPRQVPFSLGVSFFVQLLTASHSRAFGKVEKFGLLSMTGLRGRSRVNLGGGERGEVWVAGRGGKGWNGGGERADKAWWRGLWGPLMSCELSLYKRILMPSPPWGCCVRFEGLEMRQEGAQCRERLPRGWLHTDQVK